MSKEKKIILVCVAVLILLCILVAFFLYRSKVYTITFDTNGGSSIPSQEVRRGGYIVEPDAPTKSGYEFVEWRYNDKKYYFSFKVNEDITLVAVWGKATTTYTVSFDVDGVKKTLHVKDGQTIDIDDLSSLEKEGYEIKWYLDEEEFDIEKRKVTADMELKGKYVEVKTYTVTFDSNDGSLVDSQKVNENRLAKEPSNPTKEGYVFDGWYLEGVKYRFTEKVTKDITLKAKWIEDKDLKKYEVKFDSNGGSSVSSQTVVEGKTVSNPGKPTKDGYIFDGWYLNGIKYDFRSVIKSDIVLVAKWTKEVNRFTVTFDSVGGSNVSAQTVTEGSKATKPADPTKSGYTFKGWTLNGKNYDFNTVLTGNITLKAVWEAIPVVSNYTVTFDSAGGSSVPTQTVTEGGMVTRPADPTKTGYTFKGWTFNGNSYNFGAAVVGNITLTATWEAIPVVPSNYTVTFDSTGGSSVSAQTVTEGGKVTKPADPTRSGYTFKGWTLNGQLYDFNTNVSGNLTLIATWEAETYVIEKTRVDNYSLDVRLSVKKNGSIVSFINIKYNDKIVCTSTNPTINANSISSITTFQVTLTDGTVVNATVN